MYGAVEFHIVMLLVAAAIRKIRQASFHSTMRCQYITNWMEPHHRDPPWTAAADRSFLCSAYLFFVNARSNLLQTCRQRATHRHPSEREKVWRWKAVTEKDEARETWRDWSVVLKHTPTFCTLSRRGKSLWYAVWSARPSPLHPVHDIGAIIWF